MARVLELAAALSDPTIVVGDCNMSDLSTAYRQMRTTFNDAHRAAGWGLGHTRYRPTFYGLLPPRRGFRMLRLDYIFYSPHFAALEAHVGPHGNSDHRPMVARLALQKAE